MNHGNKTSFYKYLGNSAPHLIHSRIWIWIGSGHGNTKNHLTLFFKANKYRVTKFKPYQSNFVLVLCVGQTKKPITLDANLTFTNLLLDKKMQESLEI